MAHSNERELNNMAKFVDEDDVSEDDDTKICGYSIDWDETCGYSSEKRVRVRDSTIGKVYWTLVTAFVMYTVIVPFYMEGKGMVEGAGIGTVITGFKGKAFSTTGKVFDAADLRHPVLEPSGAFIMTKRVVMKDQEKGSCVDEDSSSNGSEVQTWCPSLGERNADSPPEGAIVDVIQGLETSVLTIKSGITFPRLSDQVYVAGTSEGGTTMYENITLGKLLSLATPPIVLQDITEHGAILGVSFYWSCSMGKDCEPNAVIERLDDGMGFFQKRVAHRRKEGTEVRDAIFMYGIRILIDSSGIGKELNFGSIVIQLGSSLSLLRIAAYCADLLMLYGFCLFDKSRRDAYYKCRVSETDDMTDRKEQIPDVKKERDKRKQRDEMRRKQLGSRGPSVAD